MMVHLVNPTTTKMSAIDVGKFEALEGSWAMLKVMLLLSMGMGFMTFTNEAAAQELAGKQRSRTVIGKSDPETSSARNLKPDIDQGYQGLLGESEALIRRGNPEEAYKLLEPHEFEHAGDIRFDYLLGIAALDSGRPDKATFVLERVLAVSPSYTAARMDMARAYYQLGDMSRARTEFLGVLKQNPSPAARASIERYLEDISLRESGKYTHIGGYIQAVSGYDDNVNNSTSQSQIYVDVNSSYSVLDPTNVKTADSYYGVAGGGEIDYQNNSSWGLFAGVDIQQRGNSAQKDFDSVALNMRAGMSFRRKIDLVNLGVLGGRFYLGGSRNNNTSGFDLEWQHIFSPGNQLKAFGRSVQYRYADAVMKTNDFDQHIIGLGWSHVLDSGSSSLSGSLYFGTESDVSTISNPPASPNGGRTDGAKHLKGIRLGGQTALSAQATAYGYAGIQSGDYQQVNYWFQRKRADRFYDLTLGANWHWDKYWSLRPQISYSRNDSNIVIYGYDRTDVSITVRRDFR